MNSAALRGRPGPAAARRGWLLAAIGSTLVAGAALGLGWPRWQAMRRAAVPVPEQDLCIVAPALPYDAASGVAPGVPRPVPADARCPVCGMYPARNPRWAAQVIYTDHAVHFFDSPLTLHQFLQDVGRYAAGRGLADIASRWVRDFDTGEWIDAGRAYHVHGSDALGPMRGGNLPAFASPQAAQRFAQARGGRVLPAVAIDAALLRELENRSRHRH